jgi:hypothetical protein
MRLAGHVALIGETINAYGILEESLKKRDYSEDLGVCVCE